MNGPKIMQEVDDKSKISKPKSYQPPTPSSMMQEEEGSGTEEWLGGGSVVGPGTSHPTSSSNVVTAPTLSQEVHMKSSSQPATDGESQNLTSALQVLSQPSRRVMHAQSGFFFDQDDEVGMSLICLCVLPNDDNGRVMIQITKSLPASRPARGGRGSFLERELQTCKIQMSRIPIRR